MIGDAIFYTILRSGCARCLLPYEVLSCRTVYHYYYLGARTISEGATCGEAGAWAYVSDETRNRQRLANPVTCVGRYIEDASSKGSSMGCSPGSGPESTGRRSCAYLSGCAAG
jgi:hypothetical protein